MKALLVLSSLFLMNCWGYSITDAELTGQIKKVRHENSLLCPEFTSVDVSLGFTKNGVGSMSTQDLWLTVPTKALEAQLRDAMLNNKIVKVTYNVPRFVICTHESQIVSVEELK